MGIIVPVMTSNPLPSLISVERPATNISLSSGNSSKCLEAMCPRTADSHSTETSNAYAVVGEENVFVVHCNKCQLGVYALHDNEIEERCTYCQEPRQSSN